LQRHKYRKTKHCPVRLQSFEVKPSIFRLTHDDHLGCGRRFFRGTEVVYMLFLLAAQGGFHHSIAVFRDPSNYPCEGALTIRRRPTNFWPGFAGHTV